MTHNPIDHPAAQPIEPWQLTAYALHELDAADAFKVEHALESDLSLRVELEQIQLTLASVRSALAKSPANITLDEKQSASIACQIKQVVAPNPAANTSTVKLTERPFYRRKRFAALLATAAAIPLAATWGPALFDNGGPFAVQVKGTTLPFPVTSSNDMPYLPNIADAVVGSHPEQPTDQAVIVASDDAVASGTGLVGDVDISFVPEMGLSIVKGNKKDAERVQNVIEEIKNSVASASSSSPVVASSDLLTQSKNEAQAQGLVDQYNDLANAGRYEEAEAVSKKVREIMPDNSIQEALYNNAKIQRRSEEEGAKRESKEEKWVDHFNSVEKSPGDKQAGDKQSGDKKASERGATHLGSSSGGMGGASGGGSAGGYGGGSLRGLGSAVGGKEMETGRAEGAPAFTTDLDIAVRNNFGVTPAFGAPDSGAPGAPAVAIGSAGGYGTADGLVPRFREGRQKAAANLSTNLARADNELAEKKPGLNSDRLSDLPVELQKNIRDYNRIAPDNAGADRFEKIVETPFVETQKAPLSTFSIDVDTASYSKIRQTLIEGNRLPSPSMVRIEEMVNYFQYEYAGPQDGRPFASHMIVDRCPWNPEHQLVRVGLQAKKIDTEARVKANIVFLLDVSGSMNEPNKLPLVKKSLAMMVNQLTENDRVAIVVYAGAAGCVLPSTCGIDKQRILSALDHLQAGGSTNGGQGIQLAYSIAKEHFVPGGANRVVLCTDGDFNVGVTGDEALVAMMQENAKSNVFLTCLGFGAGNYNDTMMEKISNKGNGVYGMIDNELEGRRMMVEQLGGTLVTVAKDVKIQVDFNPSKIAGYRLIGYEDRRLANKDFSDDKKDAGEIGAGHRVTALYEVIPAGKWFGAKNLFDGEVSKYAKKAEPKIEAPATVENATELLTLRVRFKEPEGSESTLQEFVLKDNASNDSPLLDRDMRWVTAVAEFGLLLRRSEMAPNANWSDMLERATSAAGGDPYRLECLTMMRKAMGMMR